MRGLDSDGLARGIRRAADVNINRFRDGIRVIEDTLRFVSKNPSAALAARHLRSDFVSLFAGDYEAFVTARNSAADPGRSYPQKKHSGIVGLLRANFARCSEALRVLEEYSRLSASSLPALSRFKNIRFRLYDLEKKSLAAASAVLKPRRRAVRQ